MPKVSRISAQLVRSGPVEDRHADLLGYTVNFVTFEKEIDAAPLLKGLPGNRCTASHWGYVFKGSVTFRYGDDREDEVFEAGDAFYAPAPHTSMASAGCEYVQFSPADELQLVSAVIQKNMKELMGGAGGGGGA